MPLEIEMIPKSSWGNNLRSLLTASEWDCLRSIVYKRANRTCEGCKLQYKTLHCHEVWEYHMHEHVQELVGFQSLCTKCHRVKHYGLAEMQGHGLETKRWMAKVNNWTPSMVDVHIKLSQTIWAKRNRIQWFLDVSYLEKFAETIDEDSNTG